MWQECVVAIVTLAAFVVAGRWLWRSIRCRQKGCAGCGDTTCQRRKAQ
ncbi:MAG: hypothetical protein II303_04260 [Alistipes sp.]|nr:hypothetical protein [Alistipes sp.]